MVWRTLFEVIRRWLDFCVTLTIHAFVICVAMLCGAGLVPTLVEADSIRRDACSCLCRMQQRLQVILEETPRGECASDALGAFLFLEEEKMDGASGKETCGGAHESVSVALTDP